MIKFLNEKVVVQHISLGKDNWITQTFYEYTSDNNNLAMTDNKEVFCAMNFLDTNSNTCFIDGNRMSFCSDFSSWMICGSMTFHRKQRKIQQSDDY